MKRVLMIGYANKYFRTEYVKNVKDKDIEFDILTFEKCSKENKHLYKDIFECYSNFRFSKLSAFFVYLKFYYILLFIKKYDIIHIHSVKPIEAVFAKLLRKKCDKLITTVYGSDFYRINNETREKLKKIFDRSDAITIASKKAIEDFNNYYNKLYSNKIYNIYFGNSMYDIIDSYSLNKELVNSFKKQFGIKENSLVITIGYNATKEQNHSKVMKQLELIKDKLPNNCFFVLPLGYGDVSYRDEVIKKFECSKFEGICLCEYLSIEEASKLRVLSDIMIQVQDTDVLSNSMLEYIYSDNIVITGSWLPYDEIKDFIIQIDSINELGITLDNIIKNIDKIKEKYKHSNRRDYIQKHYSWKAVSKEWKKLYFKI